MTEPTDIYTFGHSAHELARLLRQGRLYAPITRDIFTRAGIGPGMRVIDIGCGAGDVSLLLAEMVGPSGHVLAIDRAPEAIATTKARAREAGISWIETRRSELADLDVPERFDAAAGRLVLCYVPQRAALLRTLARRLKPGGILAFVEMDASKGGSSPMSEIQKTVGAWVYTAMQRGGFEPDMGGKLFALFAEAGLAAELAAFNIADGGPHSLAIDYFADAVESILPLIVEMGLATGEEADPKRLAAALRDEPGAETRTFYLPRLTGAWARTATA